MSGVILSVDWATEELRTLGLALTRGGSMKFEMLPHFGVDPSRADELAAAYRLGGIAGLAQALEAVRVAQGVDA